MAYCKKYKTEYYDFSKFNFAKEGENSAKFIYF